jgi:hypothetical protein
MSIEIISEAFNHTGVTYYRHFHWKDDPGAGFLFPCDERGNVDMVMLSEPGRKNYEKCIDGNYNVVDDGVRANRDTWREPAVGRCHCGEEVVLSGFTNTCEKCGTDYNSAGQCLAPRSQWGEETGEHPADIARIS